MLILGMLAVTAVDNDRFSRQALMQMVVSNPDSVLVILREADSVKPPSLPQYAIDLCRSIAYNEKRDMGLVDYYARKTLESDSVITNKRARLTALSLLSRSQSYFGNLQNSLSTTVEAIKLARELNDKNTEYDMLISIAETYFTMGDYRQGYEFLDKVIGLEPDISDAGDMAIISYGYGVKMTWLASQGRHDEVLENGEKRISLINRLEGEEGVPEGYADQQKAYTYAKIAASAQAAGKTSLARYAFDRFMSTGFGKSQVGSVYIVEYLLSAKQWDKVLEFTRPLYKAFENSDTINEDYYSLLTSNAEAYCGLGDYRKGYGLLDRATAIRDSMILRENNNRAHELAMIFSINERNLELEKSKAEAKQKHIIMVATACLSVLLLIILVILILRYRSKMKHNRVIISRIDELMQQRGQIYHVDNDADDRQRHENHREFTQMEQTIWDRRLFTAPDVNRDTIAEACGMPRSKVIRLINDFTGLTPNDYINKLRVEYSIILMQQHPNWTIDAIAEGAGYVRRATFYNHFNSLYGITPAQYRKSKLHQPT